MAKPFEPRKILKRIDNSLLREFFEGRGELLDVPWDKITEHKIEPVFEAWQALPEQKRLEVQVILRDINELTDHRGMAVLAEEIIEHAPKLAEQFRAQPSKPDKAMWMCLRLPARFAEAVMFARADALASGRNWKRRGGLPKVKLVVNQRVLKRLSAALTAFYGPKEMRGRYCKVVHYRRSDASNYFFAYLDDYPDKQIVFDDKTNRPTVRSDRYAFENVFVYNAEDKSLEIFAEGNQAVWQSLQVLFCKAVLGHDVEPTDPLRPTYKLDHLLKTDYPLKLEASDGVEQARITSMRLRRKGSRRSMVLNADPEASPNDIYRMIKQETMIGKYEICDVRVQAVSFALTFQNDGKGRAPTLRFNVSVPNSCNLRSKPDEQRVVAERCLRRWKVTDDQ